MCQPWVVHIHKICDRSVFRLSIAACLPCMLKSSLLCKLWYIDWTLRDWPADSTQLKYLWEFLFGHVLNLWSIHAIWRMKTISRNTKEALFKMHVTINDVSFACKVIIFKKVHKSWHMCWGKWNFISVFLFRWRIILGQVWTVYRWGTPWGWWSVMRQPYISTSMGLIKASSPAMSLSSYMPSLTSTDNVSRSP